MRVRRSQLKDISIRDKRSSRRGFTLVELIVVLTIIAILAAVGVVSLVGYINKAHFDENSRNAVTVYQAAQNAIAAKTAAGTADEWTRSVMQNVTHNDFTNSETAAITDVNDSYHKTISLTFNPRASRSEGSEDQALYDLLSPYFYDPSVFAGTMTVEFDVSVTRDPGGTNLYSARVIAAFYSKQNTGNSGWDAKCTNTETAVTGRLPETDLNYRQTKSFVGYFDGTEASIAGPVSLPQDQMNSDYIFTLRNGETLDVTWGFFNDPDRNAEFDIRLHDIDSTDSLGLGDVLIHIREQDVISGASSTLGTSHNVFECIKYGSGFTSWPKLEVQEGYTTISVKRVVAGSTAGTVTTTDAVQYVVPFSVTRVTRDTRDNTPDDYYTYTISLDCLMTRASYADVSSSAYSKILLSKRMFDTDTPKNISAHLENGSIPGALISESYATRAVDDPVYFTEIKVEGPADGTDQQIRYCYDITSGQAGCDTEDYCAVNTLFGDLECTDLNGQTISGSYTGSAGGKAVITSFRHLSNIRRVGTTPVEFKIARELNWFNNVGSVLLSDVKVYASTGTNTFVYHSPVESGNAKIVSFPAIPKLNAGQSLSSLSTDTGDENAVIYSINRVQMRKASFYSTDTCYGLICDNYGTVYNIYTNNVNIVAVDLADGSDSDYSKNNRNSICPTLNISIDVNGGTRPLDNYNDRDFQRPIGGLIGWNHGTVGIQGESVANGQNTIKMSNCIVMSSKYWSIYNNGSKAPTGGIIGRNENNVYGLLEVNGSFAIVNRDMVGGIIGLSFHDISARLVVDGTSDGTSDFTLPAESHNNNRHLSCAIVSKNVCGGAIGSFSYSGKTNTFEMNAEDVDFNAGLYDIDVTLPVDSMIISMVGYHDEGVGGAIGTMYKVKGDSLDIRIDNYGRILTLNTSTAKSPDLHFAGGAIGFECECTIDTTNIVVYNHQGSEIGGSITASTGATSSGGVYGKLYYKVGTFRTFNITVINEGTITARGEGHNDNVNNRFEGAGGCIGSCTGGGSVILNVTSTLQSGASVASYVNDAGGAIGYNGNIVQGSITANINGSTVTGLTDTTNNIGGVIGRNNKESAVTLTANISADSTLSGNECIGGVIGNNVKNQTGTMVSVVNGTLTGTRDLGGVIGYNGASGSLGSSTITSTVTGTISASGDYVGGAIGQNLGSAGTIITTVSGALSGNDHVAGVIGYNNKAVSGTIDTTISGSVSGANYVAGVIGDNSANGTVAGKITADITGSVTGTGEYVGGAAGKLLGVIHDATVTVGGSVTGTNYVGGILGYNSVTLSGTYLSTVSGTVSGASWIGGSVGYNNYGISGSITSNVSGNVTGTGDYVGGAMGYSTATVSASIASTIDGNINGANHVGGSIGKNDKIFNGGITTTVNGSVSGSSYVGGAVGTNGRNANNNSYVISGSFVTTVNGAVTGTGDCVGGVIGQNASGVSNGITSHLYGSVNGVNNVGGAVGDNAFSVTGEIKTYLYQDSSCVYATGDKVGGSIGYNHASSGAVTTTFTNASHVTGVNDVGGSIGYNTFDFANTVTTDMSGSSYVSGTSRVGGVLGNSSSANVNKALTLTLSGNSYIIGNDSVGGFIGENNSAISVALNAVLSGNVHICNDTDTRTKIGGAIGYNKGGISAAISASISGRAYVAGSSDVGGVIGLNDGNISANVSVAITRNEAVQGTSCVGSAIGRIGNSATPTLSSVSASINGASRPIRQIGSPAAAFIGGVIGQINNGTVTNLSISGSGSSINPANYISDAACPSKIYSRSILIYGNGDYIGGLVGYMSTGAKVTNITVDSLGLCAMSTNSSLGIGGCIGCCNGQLGTSTTNLSTYQINTVKMVYSRATYVGGFCGIIGYETDAAAKLYANVNMSFSGANINAYSDMGSVFGCLDNVLIYGDIVTDLTNNTRIGDYNGSVNSNGTLNTANCICIEAGGAVGYASTRAQFNGGKISVTFSGNSCIFAGGGTVNGSTVSELSAAGVGGAFGSIGSSQETNSAKNSLPRVGMEYDDSQSHSNRAANMGDPNRYISVISTSSSPCIYSANSNAGGVIGYIYSGRLFYAYSTAVIYNANGNSTGGVVGSMSKGFIAHCYCGGHTVGGQYVNGVDNIVGYNNVGGFIGYTGNATYIDFCYSTASVRGNDAVGGFVGYCDMSSGFFSGYGMINTSYCTGRVTANTSESVGLFCGYANDLDCLENVGDMNNYALEYYNSSNSNVRRKIGKFRYNVGLIWFTSTSNGYSYQKTVEWGTASDINKGAAYTAYAYDSYLMGGNQSVSYPYRCFVGGTHYGDWPLLQGGTNLTTSNTTVSLANDTYAYTGSAIELTEEEISVVYSRRTLTAESDYIVTYSNNTDCGVATVTITGVHGYVGSVTATFNIVQADINNTEIVFTDSGTNNLDGVTYVYNGGEGIEPAIGSITYNGIELDPNDYTVEYMNNASYGENATITITGNGNYTGSVDVIFSIIPLDFTESVVITISNAPFDFTDEESFAIDTSNIVVKVNETELVYGEDYTFAYTSFDTENGHGILTVTGIGNYAGTGSATFDITLPPPEQPTDPVTDNGAEGQDPDTDGDGSGGDDTGADQQDSGDAGADHQTGGDPANDQGTGEGQEGGSGSGEPGGDPNEGP